MAWFVSNPPDTPLAVGRATSETIAWTWGGPATGGDFVRASDKAVFCRSARAWGGLPTPDEVCIVGSAPAWPARFTAAAAPRARLGAEVVGRIEHHGSTAVPSLAAKPVVDVLVEVATSDAGRRAAFAVCSGPEVEAWTDHDHTLVIVCDPATRLRAHHLHLVPAGHPHRDGLQPRDHLRANPATAARYLALKRDLAARHLHDREAYTEGKERSWQRCWQGAGDLRDATSPACGGPRRSAAPPHLRLKRTSSEPIPRAPAANTEPSPPCARMVVVSVQG